MRELTQEEKRKLQAKMVEQQESRIRQAESRGQKAEAAKLRAEKRHIGETAPPTKELSDADKDILRAKILEQSREQILKQDDQQDQQSGELIGELLEIPMAGLIRKLLPMPGAEIPDTDFWQKRAARKVGKRLWYITLTNVAILGFTLLGWLAQDLTPILVIASGAIIFLTTCIGFRILYSNGKTRLLNRSWVVGFGILYGVIALMAIGMIWYSCWLMWY